MEHWKNIRRYLWSALSFIAFAAFAPVSIAGDGTPVTSMSTLRTAATSTSYSIGGNTINYGVGDNVRITSVNVGSLPLNRSAISKPNIKINRIDNANASGERITTFYPGLISGTTVNIEGEEAPTMELAMNDDYITSGGLDVFMNVRNGVEGANNIERVDFVVPAGINLPANGALLSEIGTVANEKHGNNTYQIAMITSVNAFNEPASYGLLRTIQGNVDYGNMGRPKNGSGTDMRNIYIRNGTSPVGGGGNGPLELDGSDTNFIGLSFVSFASMGATAGQTVYGYSLFPNDVTDANDLVGLTNVPLTTSGDIYGGTFAIFSSTAAEAQTSEGSAILEGEKTVEVYDPNLTGVYNIPGDEVIYTISVSNTGSGPADSNSIFLVDSMPSEITFYNGDIDDTGPETTPVIFNDNGSGLSFNYSTDVKFAAGTTAPTQMSDCNHSPAAGYDPLISFICIQPSGTMMSGSPNPAFDIQFRARIK